MEIEARLRIQHKALEALQESTKTLEIAERLLNVGNIREAERLRDEARQKRDVSIWLMSQVQRKNTGH
jgi:hypothetical protein